MREPSRRHVALLLVREQRAHQRLAVDFVRPRTTSARDVAIDAGPTTWLSITSLCKRWIQTPSSPASWITLIAALPGPFLRLGPQLGKTLKQPSDVANSRASAWTRSRVCALIDQ